MKRKARASRRRTAEYSDQWTPDRIEREEFPRLVQSLAARSISFVAQEIPHEEMVMQAKFLLDRLNLHMVSDVSWYSDGLLRAEVAGWGRSADSKKHLGVRIEMAQSHGGKSVRCRVWTFCESDVDASEWLMRVHETLSVQRHI
ncbi:MAG: hypothetical protein HXY34_03665 [Candidatus Thorarchaeota archaeon]|nr:hypothetical protein [Candidatus Thorarchaeota archaeon]